MSLNAKNRSSRPVSELKLALEESPFAQKEIRDSHRTKIAFYLLFNTIHFLTSVPTLPPFAHRKKMCGCEQYDQRILYWFPCGEFTCRSKQWQHGGNPSWPPFFEGLSVSQKPTLEHDIPMSEGDEQYNRWVNVMGQLIMQGCWFCDLECWGVAAAAAAVGRSESSQFKIFICKK